MSDHNNDVTLLQQLSRSLRSSDHYERQSAAQGLARQGEAAIPTLIEALADEGPGVGSLAASILAQIGVPVLEPLLQVLESEGNPPQVLGNIAYALGRIGDPGTIGHLVKLADHDDDNVRLYATEALARIEDESVVTTLRHKLDDQYWEVRQVAIYGIERRNDTGSVAKLLELLHDQMSDIRATAASVLGDLADLADERVLLELQNIAATDHVETSEYYPVSAVATHAIKAIKMRNLKM